ncbi:MAG: group II intron reverse transcriptase/maturase [Nitrososphaerota archaeon]|nr:group II intron reverse transcriptase/maturase [Nitrososphaerota archaeon]
MKSLESLQNSLYLAAKADSARKFYSLRDKICRTDVLYESWKRVKRNGGTAGIDNETIGNIELQGVEQFILRLQNELRAKTYRVKNVKRVFIPKRSGKAMRPLGIPTVEDRVVQQAVKLVIEPIFEADFQECSYGYRPNKSAKQASIQVRKLVWKGLANVVDVDIVGFFNHINHQKLLSFVMERIADPYIIKLIREWLRAGIVYLEDVTYPEEGTPQGGVISPLLANVYLNQLDTWWIELGMTTYPQNAQLVRYADDMVILTNSKDTEHIKSVFEGLLSELDLKLSPEKSRIVSAEKGFDFLSFYFVKEFKRWKGKEFVYYFPSRDAVNRFRERVKQIAAKRFCNAKDEKQLADELNRFMIGWSNYYNHTNAGRAFTRLQEFVEWKFRQFIRFRHQISRLSTKFGKYKRTRTYGLIRLTGRINTEHMKLNAAR